MKAERKIDYRHIICILITLGFVVLGIFRFFGCIGRIIESVRDCGLSVAFTVVRQVRQLLFQIIGKNLKLTGRRIGGFGQRKRISSGIFPPWETCCMF